MKVVLIAPIENLDYIKGSEMHMVLTPFVFANAKYAEFYKNENGYKILDNGTYEGSLYTIEKVIEAAELVGANEIVLPDVAYDGAETSILTRKAIEYLKSKELIGKYKLMAVPQGDNEKEWWMCYDELSSIMEVDVLGLSKLSCPKAFNDTISNARLKITRKLAKKRPRQEIHLLGGSFQILNEISLQPAFVRSIDTSAPFEYGKRRLRLGNVDKDLSQPADITKGVRAWQKYIVDDNVAKLVGKPSEVSK